MSQTLTYVIGQDRRPHVDNVQDFKVNFDGSNTNWVQARQYERSMRQVFVNIKNEDGTPLDLTGCNVWFEGLLPKNSAGDFRIIDDKGYVALDPTAGRFRFDMPGHAFTVAGSYRQAFFRILKDGNSITTLEFDLDVLADKVIDGLVPRTYISPVEELINEIEAKYQDSTDKLTKMTSDFVDKFNQSMNTLKALGATVQNGLDALEQKIKQDGLFTQAEADAFKQAITKQLNDFVDNAKKMLTTADHHLNYHAMSVSLSPTMAVDTNELNHLKYMQAQITVCDMVNIQSATDDNPQLGDKQRLTQFLDQFKNAGLDVVMLKPHLGVNWDDSFYRGNYDPTDYNAFFTNWEKILMYYADICDQHKIPILCIGCEQVKTTQPQYSGSWKLIISDIKAKYPNLLLTYALSSDEIQRDNGDWLGKLDFIGTNIYPSYTSKIDNGSNISREEIVKGFYYDRNGTQYGKLLEELHQRYHKLIYVTETGVMPQDDGLIVSVSEKMGQKPYDLNVSALAVDAAINGWMQDLPFIIGYNWWHLRGPYNIWDISTTDNSQAQEIWLQKFGGDN